VGIKVADALAGGAIGLVLDVLTVGFVSVGVVFFIAGTVGLLRFPDVYCRLHALTKANNLGLGFLFVGLALQAPGWAAGAQLALVWLLALASAATICHLLGGASLREGVPMVRHEGGDE
jgi:multicomponent Na+:H+ antiporter subunit G